MAATVMPEMPAARLGSEPLYPDGAAFIDGRFLPIAEASIPITDWGFLRSDCTYDVVHVWQGRFFRLDHHLDRFAQSCEALRLKHPYNREEMVAILMQLVRLTGLRDAYVEVICTRGVPPRGSRDPRQCANRFYAFVLPFIWIANEEVRARGINLHISDIPRIPPESINPLVKNFQWGDLTHGLLDALDQGCDMAVLSDLEGNLSEGPGFNVFVVREGTVTTPEGTCLGGITRQTALDLLGEANMRTVIGKVSPDALRHADEAFITSTAGGILPVTRVDHRPVGDGEPGPLTLRLKDRYWRKHADPAETTPVAYD